MSSAEREIPTFLPVIKMEEKGSSPSSPSSSASGLMPGVLKRNYSVMSSAEREIPFLPVVKMEEKGSPSSASFSASGLIPRVLLKDNEYDDSKSFENVSDFSQESTVVQCCSSTTQEFPEKKDGGMLPRVCRVCDDDASGFHYGVATCEACKAFFKRSVQVKRKKLEAARKAAVAKELPWTRRNVVTLNGSIEYTCLLANDCEINKRRRKSCQACRFQKCLQKGMLKEGVRLDRVRGGRQKYRRCIDLQGVSSPQRNPNVTEDSNLLEILLNCEPELPSVPDVKSTETAPSILNVLSNLYDTELVNIIGWAKQIPGFTELSLNNQMRLLQSTWTEVLTFALSYRSLNFSGKLLFASDFLLDETQAQECGVSELFHLCESIMKRLRCNTILKEEFLLLKALILANSDVDLDEGETLKKFRDAILNALTDNVSVMRGNSSVAFSLLLILPVLRESDKIVRGFWSNIRQSGTVIMNKLFTEMLDNSE